MGQEIFQGFLGIVSTKMQKTAPLWAQSRRFQSTVYVLIAVALFSVTSLLAKVLGGNEAVNQIHPFQISAFRFIFAFALIATIYRANSTPLRGIQWNWHVGRSIFGWLGVSCLFAAATQIPLGDANAISFLSVIVAMALSVYFLGENVGVRRWSAALVALLGGLLIARPGTTAFHPAALIAMASALFIGIEAIFLKKLSGRDHPLQILFCNNFIGATISLVVLVFVWQMPLPNQWLALAAIGVIMLGAQYFNILALQREEASYLLPFWYGAPLFAALYDFLLYEEVVSTWSALGIMMIVLGGVIISVRSNASPVFEDN
ncbi:MAG: DMT family transporter [Acidiferrobacterales bacterium]|nr:DMT family transporter [Acidiferrobacterales bacterium]